MSIQFLDMRIAQDSTSDTPVQIINFTTPYLFGDIGLQTMNVTPGNEGLVRVTLIAFARLQLSTSSASTIVPNATFTINRNGVEIFSTTLQKADSSLQYPEMYEFGGIQAVDYPPAAEVLTGQLRYTISASTNRFLFLGARSFSGTAVAGNG